MGTWASAYVGIPFTDHGRTKFGCDCWGLVRLIYREQFGLSLPDYGEAYMTTNDRNEIKTMIQEAPIRGWTAHPLHEAREGDALLLRMAGIPMHCGIVIQPTKFLHIESGMNAVIEDWVRPHWRRRVLGVYRHNLMKGMP